MASFSLTVSAQAQAGVSMVSRNGRRWTFPAVPPEATHDFPTVAYNEISRPDTFPFNVPKGKSLHKISFNWLLAYPDDRSIEPDLQELRGFASDGTWFTINYTPSWGGRWTISAPLQVAQKMLNVNNEITQATVTLELKRETSLTVELAPVKASSSTDIPIIKEIEVAGTATYDPAQIPFNNGATLDVGGAANGPPPSSGPTSP